MQRVAAGAAGASLVLLLTAGALWADNPWAALEELRQALEADGPLHASFEQTFLPAGFRSGGDKEHGQLAISLPQCLRWDYQAPYPKSFLLCDNLAWYWSPDESSGQRYPIEQQETPGLDFFLMRTEDLRLRYNAEGERLADGSFSIRLLPVEPTEDVVEATVRLAADHRRVLSLTFRDAEGNHTQFVLRGYERGTKAGTFAPPAGIDWQDP